MWEMWGMARQDTAGLEPWREEGQEQECTHGWGWGGVRLHQEEGPLCLCVKCRAETLRNSSGEYSGGDRALCTWRSLSPGECGMSHGLAQRRLCMGSGDWQPFASASCPIPSLAQMYHKVRHSHGAVLQRQAWSPSAEQSEGPASGTLPSVGAQPFGTWQFTAPHLDGSNVCPNSNFLQREQSHSFSSTLAGR